MGEIIIRKVKGMNWKAKIALVLMFTLVFSTFMQQGLWKPKQTAAAPLSAKGVFTKRTTTGTQTITGLPFQPKAVIFFWTKQTADGYSAGRSQGYGFAAGNPTIGNAAVSAQEGDNSGATATDANGYHSSSSSIVLIDSALNPAATASEAAVTAFTADGFTLNWTKSDAVADQIHYIALGGPDLTNAQVGTTTLFSAVGANAVTGVGFQPDAVMLLGSNRSLTLNTYAADGRVGITLGFMTTTTQGSTSWGARGGQTAYTGGSYIDGATAYRNVRGNAADSVAVYQSMDANGFTLNCTTAGGAAPISWLALKGGSYRTGVITQRTSVGTTATTGLGFSPTALILAGQNNTTANGTLDTSQNRFSIGAASAANTEGAIWGQNSGFNPNDANSRTISTKVFTHSTNPTTTNAEADLQSFDADGFTLNWTTADATARRILYFAIGGTAGNLTIGNGTNPADANAPRGSTNNALDSFTMVMSSGTGSVNSLTVTGSANFNSTNIPTNGVKVWRDAGTIGVLDGSDTLISSSSTAIAGNATTVTLSAAENVTTTAANYLVTVDINAGATLSQTFTGTVTAASGSGLGTPTYSDTSSATLTVTAAQTLTIGEGTNPANANAPQGSFDRALDGFTLSLNSGTGTVTSLTVAGSANFNSTNIPTNGVRIYRDLGTVGVYDSGVDILISSSSTAIAGNATTVTLAAAENVTTTAVNYLVAVDINAGATLSQTFTATVSGAAGSGIGTPVDSDANSATLTISAPTLPSTITSCAGCHGYGATFNDGTARNNPAGTFQGSHNKHVAQYSKTCSVCHVTPATETSADYGHRNATIQIANPINGVTGSTYSKASFVQSNTFTPGTCSNTYCHSNGTSATTPAGTIPANTSPTWGSTTTCSSCHGTGADGRPNYTDGTPKANKHQSATHAAQTCDVCHNSVTYASGVYTPDPSLHANGAYNLQASLGYTPGSASAGGTCATPGCHSSINWGGSLGCIDCHSVAQNSPIAAGINPAVTQRVAITPDFNLTSKHTRSRTPSTVTNNDCGVCHMEGNAADGSINATYHKNGYIELRDPDLGTTIKGVTHSGTTSSEGAYSSTTTDARPVRFSRNLGSATLEADTQAIMVNLCLKCHDAGGATHTSARVPSGTATNPFNATLASLPAGRVLDVASQFANTNRSFHPVLHRNNNGYTNTGGTRMQSPWNGVAKSGTTTVYGPLITCWDCHAPNGASGTLTTSGIHGGTPNGTDAVPLRGNVYTNGTTAATNLCINCHVVSGGTTNHGTGSAITSNTNGSMTYFQNRCSHCHASDYNRTRPWGASDYHGYNTRGGTVGNNQAFPAASNGYAFLRSEGWYGNGYQQSIRQVGTTTYTPTCGGRGTTGGGAGSCSRSSMGGYTPGGVY